MLVPDAISSMETISTILGPVPQPMYMVKSPSRLAVPVSLPSMAQIPEPPYSNQSKQSQGMILPPALQPISARLVHHIQAGEFIEMRDLLTNIALHDQLEVVQGSLFNAAAATSDAVPARLSEVPSLISWVF